MTFRKLNLSLESFMKLLWGFFMDPLSQNNVGIVKMLLHFPIEKIQLSLLLLTLYIKNICCSLFNLNFMSTQIQLLQFFRFDFNL
jgi:hypothetical protein